MSEDLLRDLFTEIDCFDQCPVAVRKLEALRDRVPQVDFVD